LEIGPSIIVVPTVNTMHIYKKISNAVEENDVNKIKHFLELIVDEDIINYALDQAVLNGKFDIVKLISKYWIKNNAYFDRLKESILSNNRDLFRQVTNHHDFDSDFLLKKFNKLFHMSTVNGHLDVSNYLYMNFIRYLTLTDEIGREYQLRTIAAYNLGSLIIMADNGHINKIRNLDRKTIEYNESVFFDCAARNNDLDLIKFIVNGRSSLEYCMTAIELYKNEVLDVLLHYFKDRSEKITRIIVSYMCMVFNTMVNDRFVNLKIKKRMITCLVKNGFSPTTIFTIIQTNRILNEYSKSIILRHLITLNVDDRTIVNMSVEYGNYKALKKIILKNKEAVKLIESSSITIASNHNRYSSINYLLSKHPKIVLDLVDLHKLMENAISTEHNKTIFLLMKNGIGMKNARLACSLFSDAIQKREFGIASRIISEAHHQECALDHSDIYVCKRFRQIQKNVSTFCRLLKDINNVTIITKN